MIWAKRHPTLVLLAVGLLTLAVIMVVNACRLPSTQAVSRGAPSFANIDEQEIARRLAQAITFETDSSRPDKALPALGALARFLETSFPKVHEHLRRDVVGPEPDQEASLLYTWTGANPDLKPALLISHLDVVPAKEQDGWTKDPFGKRDSGENDPTLLLDAESIWGRGTLDDKLGVLGILEATESILRDAPTFQPARTLYFGFGQDEEVSGRGARAIRDRIRQKEAARGDKPLACVLDEGTAVVRGLITGFDRPIAPIGVVEKGYVDIQLSVEQPGGHSSDAPRQTAIGILAQAIERLESNPFPSRIPAVTRQTLETVGAEMPFDRRLVFANIRLLDPILRAALSATPETNAMIRTTAAVTIVGGGEKDNILPRRATATVNYRVLPDERLPPSEVEQTVEQVRQHVQDVIDDQRVQVGVDPRNHFPPSHQSPTDGAAYATLRQVIADVFDRQGLQNTVVVAPYMVTAGTDARNYEPICEHVYRFLPVKLRSEDLAMIHGVNEHISKAAYRKVVVFYRHLIETLVHPLAGEEENPSPRQ